MNTTLLDKVAQHLASITIEQFQEEWAVIEAMNLGGPSIEEFLKSLTSTPVVSKISQFYAVSTQFSDKFVSSSSESSIYLMAA